MRTGRYWEKNIKNSLRFIKSLRANRKYSQTNRIEKLVENVPFQDLHTYRKWNSILLSNRTNYCSKSIFDAILSEFLIIWCVKEISAHAFDSAFVPELPLLRKAAEKDDSSQNVNMSWTLSALKLISTSRKLLPKGRLTHQEDGFFHCALLFIKLPNTDNGTWNHWSCLFKATVLFSQAESSIYILTSASSPVACSETNTLVKAFSKQFLLDVSWDKMEAWLAA